jgi:tRNA(fMet)-specific endonuclease VapC
VSRTLYLLDTNTVSFLINGRSREVRRHYVEAESQSARIAISAITEAEALFGLAKKPEATRLRANFDRFLAVIEVLPWDSVAARAYGDLRAALSASGKSLALMDLLIASHAIAAGATMVTHDKALLKAGGSLRAVDWATDL